MKTFSVCALAAAALCGCNRNSNMGGRVDETTGQGSSSGSSYHLGPGTTGAMDSGNSNASAYNSANSGVGSKAPASGPGSVGAKSDRRAYDK